MAARIDKSLATPLIIDQEFLRELDSRLRRHLPVIIEASAASYEVDARVLKDLIDGKRRAKVADKAWAYDKAKSACEVKYKVRWEDEVSADFQGVDDALAALDSEYSPPVRIEAKVGLPGDLFLEFEVRRAPFYPTNILIHAPLRDIRAIYGTLSTLVRTRDMPLQWLHYGWVKVTIFALALLSSMMLAGYGGARFSDYQRTGNVGLALVMFVVGATAGFGVAHTFDKAFQAVIFDFGAGTKQKHAKRLFVLMFAFFVTAVAAPILLAKWVTGP